MVVTAAFIASACGSGSAEQNTESAGDGEQASGIDMDAPWIQIQSPPLSGRYHASLVSLPDGALVLGGTDDLQCPSGWDCSYIPEPPLRDGVRYHASDESWTPIADAPVGVMTWTARAVVDQLVFFWVPADGDQIVEGSDLVAYDLGTNTWETFGLPPVKPNSRITIVGVDGGLVVGQQTREVERGGDWLLDPSTGGWSPLPDDPLGAAQWRSLAADDDLIYLFETSRDDEEPKLVRAAVLDLANMEWTRLADSEQLNAPTGLVAGVLLQPRLETADGGEVNNWGRSYSYGGIYDPSIDEWRSLPNIPTGEHQFAAGVIAGDSQLISHYRNWMLNWDTQTWHRMPSLGEIRTGREEGWVDGASFAWAGDGLLVVGGVIWDGAEGELRSDAWIWRPRPATVGGDEPAAVQPTPTMPQRAGGESTEEPPVADDDDPTDAGLPPDCATIVPSAELLASLPASIDEMRNQLPVMHELYLDTVLVWEEFGIQPNHMMIDGSPRMLIQVDDADGRCEQILAAVARPELVRFVRWTEGDYSEAINLGGLPPWRQLIESDVGYTRGGTEEEQLWISIGTGLYGVTSLTLRADQEELAAMLLDRYAELIKVGVGGFAYPPERVDPEARNSCGTLPVGRPAADITLSTPILRGDVHTGQLEVVISNDGTSTVHLVPSRIAELTTPGSSDLVAAFIGGMTAEDRGSSRLDPGAEVTVTASPATASCNLDIGYSVPAGRYDLVFPIHVFDAEASENDVSDTVLLPRLEIELS